MNRHSFNCHVALHLRCRFSPNPTTTHPHHPYPFVSFLFWRSSISLCRVFRGHCLFSSAIASGLSTGDQDAQCRRLLSSAPRLRRPDDASLPGGGEAMSRSGHTTNPHPTSACRMSRAVCYFSTHSFAPPRGGDKGCFLSTRQTRLCFHTRGG